MAGFGRGVLFYHPACCQLFAVQQFLMRVVCYVVGISLSVMVLSTCKMTLVCVQQFQVVIIVMCCVVLCFVPLSSFGANPLQIMWQGRSVMLYAHCLEPCSYAFESFSTRFCNCCSGCLFTVCREFVQYMP